MKSTEFCYWLMGSLELNENKGFNEKQTQILKNHLNMCFLHMVKDDGTLRKEGDGVIETSEGFDIGGSTPHFNC